jgi:hypothetical protein
MFITGKILVCEVLEFKGISMKPRYDLKNKTSIEIK